MSSQDRVTYHLTVYGSTIQWTAEISVPAHRRLTDFINDNGSAFLVLNHVTPATRENDEVHPQLGIETLALVKQNIIAIIPGADLPQVPVFSNAEKIPKLPFRVIVYAPPLALAGEINIPRNVDWLASMQASGLEFVALTNVSTWDIRTRRPLDAGSKFGLVNRRWITGFEPK